MSEVTIAGKPRDGAPIRLLSRRLVAENSRFHVYLDQLADAKRIVVEDYLTVVPKEATAAHVTGVAVVPLHRGKIVLVKNYRHPIQEAALEVPRGFIGADEEPEAAAARELEEETGLSCLPDAIRSLGVISPDPGLISARVQLFVATQCTRRRRYRPAELGHMGLYSFTPEQVKKMILGSEIQDAVTAVACMKYLMTVGLSKSP